MEINKAYERNRAIRSRLQADKTIARWIAILLIATLLIVLGIQVYWQERELKDMQQTNSVLQIQLQQLQDKCDRLQIKLKKLTGTRIETAGTYWKGWEPAVFDSSSEQARLQRSAYTDEHGLKRVGNDYCIALGYAYGTKIGTRYRIHLSNGTIFTAVLADQKALADTDASGRVDGSGGEVEFVVNAYDLNPEVRCSGNVSSIDMFNGTVDSIYRI